jgi:hypothetical protein
MIYKFKPFLLFSILVIITLLNIYLFNSLILNESFFYTSLGNQMSLKRIEDFIINTKNYRWVSFLIMPIYLVLVFYLVSLIVYTGVRFFEINIAFKNCFKIILIAETIPLISSISKTLYFYIYPPSNFVVLQNFNPLGLSSLISTDSIPKYVLYPIQQLNLFEVGYWFLLAYGIKSLGNVDFKKALKITSLSYGVGLLIWCIFIVFLQLQFS